MNAKKKETDFEVNLLPVLSVLSICICFLLTSAVWNRMGYIGVNQAIGSEMSASGKNEDSIHIQVKNSGRIVIQLRKGDDGSIAAEKNLAWQESKPDWMKLRTEIGQITKLTSSKIAIVMPEIGINYGKTLELMDQLKSLSLNIGLAPAVREVR